MNFNLSLLKKIRCRFLNRVTGKPVPGVIASLSVSIGDDDASVRVPVGTLCSDRTGYAAFDLKPLIDRGLSIAQGVTISALGHGLRKYDVLQQLMQKQLDGENEDHARDDEPGRNDGLKTHMLSHLPSGDGTMLDPLCIVFPVYLEQQPENGHDCENGCATTSLASIQSPDASDYKVSPYSFVSPAKVSFGGDCCETLVPSTLPVQEYNLYKVIVRNNSGGSTDYDASIAEVEVTDTLESRDPLLKFGEVLEYRQSWYAVGHSLGEIKYSLPLAPGESTQLAVIEWSRQDTASRIDRVRGTEFLDHELKRDRAIEETVDAVVSERQGGWSWMGGMSTSAQYDTKVYGDYRGNAGVGGSVTNTWGERDVEGGSLQDLHDKVTQTTGYIRSLKSTVIVQATQAEQNVLQTRRVANHNHCHAMTIQYYEVLRHYRLRTEFARRRKAVLIPFSPFEITWQRALRFRTLLERVLLDERLLPCFDAVVRLHLVPGIYDGEPANVIPKDDTKPPKVQKTKQVVVPGVLGEGVGSGVTVQAGDSFSFTASGAIRFSTAQTDSPIGPNGSADAADNSHLAPGLRNGSLVFKIGQSGAWQQGGTYRGTTAATTGEIVFGVNGQPGRFETYPGQWEVTVTYLAEDTPPPVDPEDRPAEEDISEFNKISDQLCEAKLLTHLGANQGFYNRAVWMLMDPTERRLHLQTALGANADILSALGDTPLAASGNYVAFDYYGPLPDWTDRRDGDPDYPLEAIVTLPTRGLFAEAQLGNCNSCEKRDITRMSDWKEMTAEEPPTISGIEPGPQGNIPALTPASLPSNVIQITQPQNAPDPTGLARALEVLKTPNLFRDMSGLDEVSDFLGTLAAGLLDNPEAIKKGAADAKGKVDDAKKTGESNGSGGSNGTKGRTEPNEKNAGSQIDKLAVLDEAKDRDLITDEQANDSAMGILGGEIIQAGTIDRNISMPMGIDVSHHQGNIDWEKVAESNVYFAFIKASDGQNTDNRFQINWRNARDNGITCGAYHYWLPQVAGKKQAETLIRQVGFLRGDLPPVLDIEDGPHANFAGLSASDLEDNIQEFLDTVQGEFGVAPIIYTYPGFWTGKMNDSKKFSNYLLWIANYSPKNDPTLPGGWPTWEFWQMTDSGRVDGITGLVDMNMFNGDLKSLWIMAGKNPKTIEA